MRPERAETQPSKSEADLRRFQFVQANLVLLHDYPLCRLSLPLSLSTLIILSLPFNLCKSYSFLEAAVTKLRRENSRSRANKIAEYSQILNYFIIWLKKKIFICLTSLLSRHFGLAVYAVSIMDKFFFVHLFSHAKVFISFCY